MIRLLLVDDGEIFREGLEELLSLRKEIEVVGQAGNGKEAISFAAKLQPDVILMDVRMSGCNGVEATRSIHRSYPWIKIVMLTVFDDDEYIGQSLQAGAIGYLLKRTPVEQLVTAIRSAYSGYSQLGPTIAPKVFAQLSPKFSASIPKHKSRLSKRELEVLQLIAQGKNNREIAEELYITEGTVRNYVTRILRELELRDRISAVLWANKYLQSCRK
ncbi:response regulator transcription factor [Pleurocapsales cyanobacterium LEGE 10410]|nr:response regulator transcription factor [Pleurocapsales cyanobacterium LEGE 10410]